MNAKNIVACICVLIALGFVLTRTGTDRSEKRSRTDRELGNLKAESSIVSVEIERAGTAGSNLGKALDRINTEINASRGTINDFRERINDFKRIINECQKLTSENTAIIERIDQANR